MESITLSAIGRDLQVGDLYNYYTDDIWKNLGEKPEKILVEVKSTVTKRLFTSQLDEKYTQFIMGINSHFDQSIANGTLDLSKLWFGEYLKTISPTEIEDDGARVTVFFQVERRTETISKQCVGTNMPRYQLNSNGRATHVIDQVVYGGEFIFSMRKTLDMKTETKTIAENSIYKATTEYLDQIISSNWAPTKLPTQLEGVSCTVFSSLNVFQTMTSSIQHSVSWLGETIKRSKDDGWRPVTIRLSLIPSQLETRLLTEKITTRKLELNLNLRRISAKSNLLSTHPCLQKIAAFRNILNQFRALLDPLQVKLDEFHSSRTTNSTAPQLFLEEQQQMVMLLSNAMAWLLDLRQDVATLHSILKDTQLNVMDLMEIETRTSFDCEHQAKVFVLKVDYQQDLVMKRLYKFVDYPSLDFKRPVFSILSANKRRLESIGTELVAFADNARRDSNPNSSYQIGLVSLSSPLVDGTILTLSYGPSPKPSHPEKSFPSSPPPLIPIFPIADDPTDSVSDSSGEDVQVLN